MTEANWSVELLPVFLDTTRGIRWLSLADARSWQVDGGSRTSPQEVVRRALRVFGVGPFVAHSTSWRFDSQLILTYLILLPTLHGAPPAGFEVNEVKREPLARGDLAAPPPQIEIEQVLEHALRHLAWLARDDPPIRSLLAESWLETLEVYRPEPFRSLQDVFSF